MISYYKHSAFTGKHIMVTLICSCMNVKELNNVKSLPLGCPPLQDIVLELREMLNDSTATGYGVEYSCCVEKEGNYVYGDLENARSKVKSAYDKRIGVNNKINEHRVDASRKEASPEIVCGELEYAVEHLDKALDRFVTDIEHSDCQELKQNIKRIKNNVEIHMNAADNGNILIA